MKIRSATINDISFVVDIHIEGFEGFFLTLMGKEFLSELYKAFALRNHGVLRVLCDENDRIIGFAGGSVNPVDFYRSLKKDKGWLFFIRAFPALILNPVLVFKKLWYSLFFKGEVPKDILNAALLSSIAVYPSILGKSCGTKLLLDYEETIKAAGFDSLCLTTDKNGNDAVVRFYKRNDYKIESEFVQADGREMLRLLKVF